MKTCEYCGQQNDSGVLMYPGCGTELSKTPDAMQRQPATAFERSLHEVLRAVKFGVLIECLLCGFSVIYVLTGGFGPCGPARDVPGFVRLVHLPGSWVSGLLSEGGGAIQLPVCLATTTAVLSVMAYIVLRFLHGPQRKLSI